MQAIVSPGFLQGTIKAVPSKSMMQRVCAAALLHRGRTTIYNAGQSDDDKAALHIIQQLGATVQQAADIITINSTGIHPITNTIDCGESGLSARLFIPIAATAADAITITGHGSLLKRPMHIYSDILPQLNVQVQAQNGHLPFTVSGPLQAKPIELDGSLSSQFLSGMLFAYAFTATMPVTITVKELNSKPYIDLTLQILKQFGKIVTNDNYENFTIDPSLFKPVQDVEISIEGDWSSASFWLAGAAISGDVTVQGLNTSSLQADKAILDVLQSAGAWVQINDDSVQVKSPDRLRGFEIDATDCPDLFPILSVMAGYCRRDSTIHGVHRLFHKESNRAGSVSDMLYQFGTYFSMENDSLVIEGRYKLDYTTIDSYNDHRIAMSAAIGALRAKGDVIINDAGAVSKSYPGFFRDLEQLGIRCSINTNEIINE